MVLILFHLAEEEELLRLLTGGDTKSPVQPSVPPVSSSRIPYTPSYKSTSSPDYTKRSTDSYKPAYKSSTSGRDSRPLQSSYPTPMSSSYKPSSQLPSATTSVSSPYSTSKYLSHFLSFASWHADLEFYTFFNCVQKTNYINVLAKSPSVDLEIK